MSHKTEEMKPYALRQGMLVVWHDNGFRVGKIKMWVESRGSKMLKVEPVQQKQAGETVFLFPEKARPFWLQVGDLLMFNGSWATVISIFWDRASSEIQVEMLEDGRLVREVTSVDNPNLLLC